MSYINEELHESPKQILLFHQILIFFKFSLWIWIPFQSCSILPCLVQPSAFLSCRVVSFDSYSISCHYLCPGPENCSCLGSCSCPCPFRLIHGSMLFPVPSTEGEGYFSSLFKYSTFYFHQYTIKLFIFVWRKCSMAYAVIKTRSIYTVARWNRVF